MKRYVIFLSVFIFYGVANAESHLFDATGRPIASPSSVNSRNVQAIGNCLTGQGNPAVRAGVAPQPAAAGQGDVGGGAVPAIVPDFVGGSTGGGTGVAQAADGSILFQTKCAGCHSVGGKPPGKPIQNKSLGATRVVAGTMPPTGALPPAEAEAIAKFLRGS